TRYLSYRMRVVGENGRRYRIEGKKIARNSSFFDLWPSLTTLYLTVHDETLRRMGVGILRLSARDFARQLTTLKARDAKGLERFDVQARFIGFFLSMTRRLYGRMLAPAVLSTPDARPRPRRRAVREPEPYTVETSDTTRIHLTRYRGG